MHRRPAVLLTAVAVLATGCTAGPTGPGPQTAASAPPAGPSRPALDPVAARACRDATTIINDSTAAFTAAVDRAQGAGERGDTRGRDAAMNDLRAAFRSWSARLRTVAAGAGDPAVQSALYQYAGAVTATIGRVRTAADLERLYTFTETELDLAASQFATVCG